MTDDQAHKLIAAFEKAAIENDRWMDIAPAGLSTSQKKKELRLANAYSATREKLFYALVRS